MHGFLFCKFSPQASSKGAVSKALTPPGKRESETPEEDVVLMESQCKAAPAVKPIEKKKMPVGGFSIFICRFCILCSGFLVCRFCIGFLVVLPMRYSHVPIS